MSEKKSHRPVDRSKQQAILAAARDEFFAMGYIAASIERIAAMADVSKVTIYKHFHGKQPLFAAVVERECEKMRTALAYGTGDSSDFRAELLASAQTMVAFLSNDDVIRFDRRLASEFDHAPDMADLFLEAGPHRLRAILRETMAAAMAAGHIEAADPHVAASHFFGLVRGFTEVEWRFGNLAGTVPDDAAIADAVDRFLRAYAP
jgi:TetR/AcrR family transcriptional regulator, mexJK operon transcriptional repressor